VKGGYQKALSSPFRIYADDDQNRLTAGCMAEAKMKKIGAVTIVAERYGVRYSRVFFKRSLFRREFVSHTFLSRMRLIDTFLPVNLFCLPGVATNLAALAEATG
jgi:hypothetical protein